MNRNVLRMPAIKIGVLKGKAPGEMTRNFETKVKHSCQSFGAKE